MRLLWDLIVPDADGTRPRQPLTFATGPLSGTLALCNGRTCVVFRSPATGTLGASNGGGDFDMAMRRAGWDYITIIGKADQPVYLFIDDDKVEIRPATDLWGKSVSQTEEILKTRLGLSGVEIASIGPAGENGVMFASIMTDKYRAFGRGGPGKVMGAKHLKAIAIHGTHKVPVADPEGFKEASLAAREELFSEACVRDDFNPTAHPHSTIPSTPWASCQPRISSTPPSPNQWVN